MLQAVLVLPAIFLGNISPLSAHMQGRGNRQVTVVPSAMRPTRRVLQRVCPRETVVVVRLRISCQLLLKDLFFASSEPRRAVQKKQMPFLAVAPRLAVRAVKGAPFAFTGAKRKPLTEEAHGLGAGFCQEGKTER